MNLLCRCSTSPPLLDGIGNSSLSRRWPAPIRPVASPENRGGCRGGAGAPLGGDATRDQTRGDRPAALDRLQGQIPEKIFGAPLPLSGDPCSWAHAATFILSIMPPSSCSRL